MRAADDVYRARTRAALLWFDVPAEGAKMKLSERLRSALVREQGQRSTRELGKTLAMNHTTLWRFMVGGTPSADLVDKLYARYFEKSLTRPTKGVD